MRGSAIVSIVMSLLLAGCVSASDPSAVAGATQTSFNPHTGLRETSGAVSPINNNILEGFFNLRSFAAPSGSTVHQVYLSVSSNEWMFLHAAYAYGSPLNFVAIDRAVGACSRYGCTIRETVGVNLTEEELRQFAQTGFVFQLSGQRGSRVVSIPAAYFQGYLSRLHLSGSGQSMLPASSGRQDFPPAPPS